MGVLTIAAVALSLLSLGSSTIPEDTELEFVKRYAPVVRFDSVAGTKDRCFPSNAQDYYNARQSGNTDRICNLDYNTITNDQVPTYWHAMECGYHLHIAYWNFYGYNHDCDCCSGERDAWWEYIVVKIRDWDLDEHMHEVMFGQKKGWYTRIPGQYQVLNQTHPVAYVGKSSHGFYHDDGGTGTCCYYEDYRDPGEPNQHMYTWHNLIELDPENGESWMADNTTNVWNGYPAPTFRDNWNLCSLVGCTGSFLQVCGTCGCHKSDIEDDPF